MKLRGGGFWVLARLAVGVVFAYAGFMKLIEPVENFQAVIAAYRIVPPALAPIAARAVPWLEWLAGACLVLGYLPRTSAGVVSLLSAAFSVLLAAGLLGGKGLPHDCGCFGASGLHLSPPQALALDLVSLALALRLACKEP